MSVDQLEGQHLRSSLKSRMLPVERLDEHFPKLKEELGGRAIYLVRADMNPAGTFKLRGALHAAEIEVSRGATAFSTASAGNHARGLMVAAREFNMPVGIVVPRTAPPQKSTELHKLWQELGGDPSDMTLTLYGQNFDEAYEYALSEASTVHNTFIHPFDNVDVIAGQGKHFYDILDSLPDVTRTISPTGGGGLAAGLQGENAKCGSPLTMHFIEAEGSNSLSTTLQHGSIEPLAASNPNKRYGGVAVSRVGNEVVRTLWRSLYDHQNILTAYDEGVRELAQMYAETDNPTEQLEPTALLAVEGLRQLVRQQRLSDDDVVAVIATGHNEFPEALLTEKDTGLSCVSGYTKYTPPSRR